DGPLELLVQTRLKNFLTNEMAVAVTQIILGPTGSDFSTKLQRTAIVPASSEIEITNLVKPIGRYELWSPESPTLYKLVTLVSPLSGPVGLTVHGHYDETEIEFGIRTFAFDKDKGFLLNGQPYVLKGTCNHQDMAGVGAALPDALQS